MDVTEAVERRTSIRAFTDEPVPDDLLRSLVERAARAPSGGNLQPWRIYAIPSATMPSLLEVLDGRPLEPPEYPVYPADLWEPYRTRRFTVGEQMYALLGIPRDDKAARLTRFAENHRFFGATAAVFCFVDRGMGAAQWSDLGMYLQTFMLLATEAGLATCPQEAWATYPRTIAEFVGAPDEEMLFCGVAVGHADSDAPVNALRAERDPLDRWATFVPPGGALSPSR